MFTAIKILFSLLFSSSCFAVVDVAGATSGIDDGIVAVTAVLQALLVAYGMFYGLKMVVRYLRYGDLDAHGGYEADWDGEYEDTWEYEQECIEEFERSIGIQAEMLNDDKSDMDMDEYAEMKGYDPIDWDMVERAV